MRRSAYLKEVPTATAPESVELEKKLRQSISQQLASGLTQAQVAGRLDMYPPNLTRLLRRPLTSLPVDQLTALLAACNVEVELAHESGRAPAVAGPNDEPVAAEGPRLGFDVRSKTIRDELRQLTAELVAEDVAARTPTRPMAAIGGRPGAAIPVELLYFLFDLLTREFEAGRLGPEELGAALGEDPTARALFSEAWTRRGRSGPKTG